MTLRLPAKKHKFNAQPTHMDGVRFASKSEAQRYRYLKLLEKAGEIRELQLQPVFDLVVPFIDGARFLLGEYRADFSYRDAHGQLVVEDVKGMDTPLSKWKRKHTELQYGITVRLIRKHER